MMMVETVRSPEGFARLNSFLDAEGVRDAFQAVAIKEVLAWRIAQAMKARKICKTRMAERMGASRGQIRRLFAGT